MKKIIVWGIGDDYERIHNQLLFEEYKKNIEILAMLTRKEDIYSLRKDGHPVISIENLISYEYDYIVVTSTKFFDEIATEAVKLGIEREKLIPGKVFNIQNFDFTRYVNLIENPITIFSDDCWGGYIYNSLGLQFSSPTINLSMDKSSYIKFLVNLEYYLNQPLSMKREGNLREGICPQGVLGSNEQQITLSFHHSLRYSDAEQEWNRRRKRVNFNNIFVKMILSGDNIYKKEYIKAFNSLPYKKVCFCAGNIDYLRQESYVYLPKFESNYFLQENKHFVPNYSYEAFIRNMKYNFSSMDILKMLNGEKEYLRD